MRTIIILVAVLSVSCLREDAPKKQAVKLPNGSYAYVYTGGILLENNRMDNDCTLTVVEKDGTRTTTLNCE